MTTKKAKSKQRPDPDRDTLRPEYELFPNSEAVNEALRELAAIAKRASRVKRKRSA